MSPSLTGQGYETNPQVQRANSDYYVDGTNAVEVDKILGPGIRRRLLNQTVGPQELISTDYAILTTDSTEGHERNTPSLNYHLNYD